MIKTLAIAIAITAATLTPGVAFAGQQNDETPATPTTVYPPNTDPKSLDASLTDSACVDDAPYVIYKIVPKGFDATGKPATITVMDLNRNVITVKTNQPLTGKFLYPGAAVDPVTGAATDWPGWKLVNGEWEKDPTDAFLRDGLIVKFEVNPTTEATVRYPPAQPKCTDPEDAGSSSPATTQPAQAAAGSLPRTGSDGADTFLQIGAMLLVAGGVVVIATRRRRSSPAAG